MSKIYSIGEQEKFGHAVSILLRDPLYNMHRISQATHTPIDVLEDWLLAYERRSDDANLDDKILELQELCHDCQRTL